MLFNLELGDQEGFLEEVMSQPTLKSATWCKEWGDGMVPSVPNRGNCRTVQDTTEGVYGQSLESRNGGGKK